MILIIDRELKVLMDYIFKDFYKNNIFNYEVILKLLIFIITV